MKRSAPWTNCNRCLFLHEFIADTNAFFGAATQQ